MPGSWITLSCTVTTASVNCRGTTGQRSCRRAARAVLCTATSRTRIRWRKWRWRLRTWSRHKWKSCSTRRTVGLHDTCTRYLCPHSINDTCARHFRTHSVHDTCTRYLCTPLRILCLNAILLHPPSIRYQCTIPLYSLSKRPLYTILLHVTL